MKPQGLSIFNAFNIYVFVWVLYGFHWNMPGRIPLLDSLSNAFLGLNLAISVYYFLFANFRLRLPRVLYVLDVLLLLFVVYGLWSIVFGGDVYVGNARTKIKNGSYLIGVLRSFLPIYVFYVFSLKGFLNPKSLLIWGGLIFAQYLYAYLGSSKYSDFGAGGFVSGSAYLFTSLFPFLFLIKRRKTLAYVLLAVLSFLVLMGLKRGAIVITIAFIIYYVWHSFKTVKSTVSKWGVAIVAVLFFGISINYVSDFYNNNSKLQQRVEETMEGNSSGRDVIAADVLEQYSNADFKHLLFGFGADGTLKLCNSYAHNDWLEMLVDTGVVGLMVYFAFWLSLFRFAIMAKGKSNLGTEIMGVIVVIFPRTLFSMLYSNLEITLCMILAFFMAKSFCFESQNNRETSFVK